MEGLCDQHNDCSSGLLDERRGQSVRSHCRTRRNLSVGIDAVSVSPGLRGPEESLGAWG